MLAVLAPCAGRAAETPAPAPMPATEMSKGPAGEAMVNGMARMQHDMGAAPMTGDPDRDFVAMMKPHHAGAIDMAKIELQYGRDPDLRALAEAIVAAQEKEIAFMAAWQAKHPAP